MALLCSEVFFFSPSSVNFRPVKGIQTKMQCFSEAEALKEVNLWPVWEAGLALNT